MVTGDHDDNGGGSYLPEADPVIRGVDDDEAIVAVLLTGRDAALFEVLLAGAGGGVAPGIGNAYTGGVASRTIMTTMVTGSQAKASPSVSLLRK